MNRLDFLKKLLGFCPEEKLLWTPESRIIVPDTRGISRRGFLAAAAGAIAAVTLPIPALVGADDHETHLREHQLTIDTLNAMLREAYRQPVQELILTTPGIRARYRALLYEVPIHRGRRRRKSR